MATATFEEPTSLAIMMERMPPGMLHRLLATATLLIAALVLVGVSAEVLKAWAIRRQQEIEQGLRMLPHPDGTRQG